MIPVVKKRMQSDEDQNEDELSIAIELSDIDQRLKT